MGEIKNCQVMDAGSVPVTAFAEALSRQIDTTAWIAELSWLARRQVWPPRSVGQAGLRTIRFPLQRGYQYEAVNKTFGVVDKLYGRLVSECGNAEVSALICTSPYWTTLAEQWPGPVIYHSLDYTYAYDGVSPARILELDQRLCRKAVRVFPVSRRIGDYLVARAGCAPEKITVLPNATLSQNLRAEADGRRAQRPDEWRDINGPIAGVIGNMADNIDWRLLEDSIGMTPWLHWVFIGPYDTKLADRLQSRARSSVMAHPRTCFSGLRPYDRLQTYARSLDVAVMPYRRKEPTYSGSAMRFYEHLAAGRPMIATRNVEELLEKEPLLRLVDDAAQLANELGQLRDNDFCDGMGEARTRASRNETWDVRAQTMLREITRA